MMTSETLPDGRREITIRGKWMFDECISIDEMIQCLEDWQNDLRQLEDDGFEYIQGGDDYTTLREGGL